MDYCKSSMTLLRNRDSLGGQEAIDPRNRIWGCKPKPGNLAARLPLAGATLHEAMQPLVE